MPLLSYPRADAALGGDWPAPDPRCATGIPMQLPAWMSARAHVVGHAAIRRFEVAGPGRPAALAALTCHQGWLRELPHLFEPSDLLWSSPQALAALARALAAQPLPIYLERVPSDSPSIDALRRAYRGRGLVRVAAAMPTPVIDLACCAGDADACVSARQRADLRRAERKAQRHGEPSYAMHAPATLEELATLAGEAMAVESRSWKMAAGTALPTQPFQNAFFEALLPAALADGSLRIALLHIDGRAVAMQIALVWHRRYWLLKISHDAAYADCSPGQLLIGHTLRLAARQGLAAYEFMGVMAPWTALWTREHRHYVSLRLIPFSLATGKLVVRRLLRRIGGRA